MKQTLILLLLLLLLLFLLPILLTAGEVDIVSAKFIKNHNNSWNIDVSLKHGDTGWDHYADNWRVVDPEGNILGDRVLYHPHINEQPFTRSLSNITINNTVKIVYIEAHDKEHGWTKKSLKIDLNRVVNSVLKVESN